MPDDQQPIRDQLIALLDGRQAHATFDDAVADLPPDARGRRASAGGGEVDHTAWRLVEHLRLAQHDILEYVRNPDWRSPPWPEGFWPDGDAPPSDEAWDRSLAAFRADLTALRDLVADASNDLLASMPHAEDPSHTLMRQAMLTADHNAYHIGQLVYLRRALGVWPG